MSNALQQSLRCRVSTLLERFEQRKWLLLVLFSVVYFIGFCFIASKQVISNDELFTYYIARLPTFHDVWRALATGAEQTPPLFYTLTRADFALLGTSALAIRIPELLAFAVMCICLFHFVSRRTSVFYGFIAMLFPLMTTAYNYVVFARPYAFVLAFSAFALLCWQWATEGQHRTPALVGLTVSLVAAISSHYYAVLCLFPLGLGELVRSTRRKRIDWGIWTALVLSMFPLLLFLPLIESARKLAPHFWAKPHWSSMAYYYQHFLLSPIALPLMAIFLVVVAYAALRQSKVDLEDPRLLSCIATHEIAAVLGFLLIPVVGVLLGKTIVGAFSDRYALPAVIGVAIAVAWGLYAALDANPAVAFILGVLLCVFLVVKEVQTYRRAVAVQDQQASTYTFLEAHAKKNIPIVISSPIDFLELTYDAPESLSRRLTYLADPKLGIRYTGTNDVEQGLLEMKHWAGLSVHPFRSFVASGEDCYILFQTSDYPYDYDWVIPALKAAHWKIQLLQWTDGKALFLGAHDSNGSASVRK